MTLHDYFQGLLNQFHEARIVRNLADVLERIVEHSSIRLWSISPDRAAFERSKRLVDGRLETVVDEQTVAAALREQGGEAVRLSDHPENLVILLHDPCDIRKPQSTALECLGTVRSLDGELISGYQTFNTVVIDEQGHTPQPLDISVYSNGDPHYLREEELAEYDALQRETATSSSSSSLSPERVAEIRQYVEEGSAINLNRVLDQQLTQVSERLQRLAPQRDRCHVLDRQFDGDRYFTLINDDLQEFFVIRLKASRTVPGIFLDGHPGALTVMEVPCPSWTQYALSKIRIHHRTYQNVTCHLAWRPLTLKGVTYTMVRITLIDRHGRPIFAHPMVLLTNLPVACRDDARRVYRIYLLRAKIEGVFKFCKTVLGWEEAQVRDYASIRRLLVLAFYLAGYFYASDSELIENPVIAMICLLGGGKGGLSRYFFLQGLKQLFIYRTVLRFQQQLSQHPQEGVSFEDMMAFIS